MKTIEVKVKKVQKKYYFTEETAQLLKLASAYSGFSQSKILESVIVVELVKEKLKGKSL